MIDLKSHTEKPIYFKGLNGIRAIAAMGVLISHINLGLKSFNITKFSLFGFREPGVQNGWGLGEHGVTMFFVLSGFLITYLLLLEKEKKHFINRKNFYLRRILRIWPLYFFYFLITCLFISLGSNISLNLSTVSLYVFLLANVPFVLGQAFPACDHLWSIAVEEQYYLFWPIFFRKKIDFEYLLIAIILIFIIVRIIMWIFFPFTITIVLPISWTTFKRI